MAEHGPDFAHLVLAGLQPAMNARVALHLTFPTGQPCTVLRFRVKVYREHYPATAQRWRYEVRDICRPLTSRVVRSGSRRYWQDAVDDGLTERNRVEQDYAWRSQ
jgi:hypothetical protein